MYSIPRCQEPERTNAEGRPGSRRAASVPQKAPTNESAPQGADEITSGHGERPVGTHTTHDHDTKHETHVQKGSPIFGPSVRREGGADEPPTDEWNSCSCASRKNRVFPTTTTRNTKHTCKIVRLFLAQGSGAKAGRMNHRWTSGTVAHLGNIGLTRANAYSYIQIYAYIHAYTHLFTPAAGGLLNCVISD